MLRSALRLTPAPAHYLIGSAFVLTQLVRAGWRQRADPDVLCAGR
jgi:hypothetical protein